MKKTVDSGKRRVYSALIMTNDNNLQQRIQTAIAATPAKTKARREALAAIRWVLRDEHGNYAALDSKASIIAVEDVKDALVFDGRDNEDVKRGYYSRVTGMGYRVELV